ncbi:Putative S-adenosyl-L-methionine-dependent methyltransferase [Anaerolineales bacterium]|nr:Putative S-adenosyl-L-methionine-dependent methyltransferase [Anaerolineales bacterium]
MRKNQTSMTAIGIAIVRGIESEKPEGERICYDPYARQFTGGFLYNFVRFFDKLGYSERKGPGVMGFLTVRERHIDEFLKGQLQAGAGQVVILGAGLDARAYRFDELKKIRVFEVDHPASQASKKEKVKRIFGELPAHVTYVSIDFNLESLEQRLTESDYDKSLKTLFIWQGVTQYLMPEAVDSTLAFIARHSPAGSSVIFDYMYPTLLDGTIKRGEVNNMRSKRWASGEMLVFGIPEGTATAYLEQRGFIDVKDADSKFLHDAYFHGKNASRTVAHGYAIASAMVK